MITLAPHITHMKASSLTRLVHGRSRNLGVLHITATKTRLTQATCRFYREKVPTPAPVCRVATTTSQTPMTLNSSPTSGTAEYRNAFHGDTRRSKRLSYTTAITSSTLLFLRNCSICVRCATSGSLHTCGTRRRRAIQMTFKLRDLR